MSVLNLHGGNTPYYVIELDRDKYGFGFGFGGGLDHKSDLMVQKVAKGIKSFEISLSVFIKVTLS